MFAGCNRVLSLLFLTIFVFWGSGCGRYFAPDRNLKKKVEESQITGDWILTDQSTQLFKRDGFDVDTNKTYKIRFEPDGKCIFQSLFNNAYGNKLLKCEGSWKLEHDLTESGRKIKNEIQMDLLHDGIREILGLGVAKENSELVLWSFYGDPDSWEFVEYHKLQNQ